MVSRSRLPFLFLFFLLSLSATTCLARLSYQGQSQGEVERQYQECQSRCQQQGRTKQQQQCQQECEQQRQEQQQQQQQGRDPQQQYQECSQQCQQQRHQHQSQCQQRCDEQLRRSQEQEQHQGGQGQRNNPYLLDRGSFQESISAQHGHVRVSPRFSQISNLLRGLEDYRITHLQANPSSFMIPHHLDADAVFFVARGRGTINLVQQQNRESYNLEQGDVIRVPSGAMFYLINRDNNDRFQIVSLIRSNSARPGTFKDFFPVGQNEPESYFNAFSDEILEAAFNTPRDQVDRLFRQQNQEEFVRASEQQIRAMTQGASSSQQGSPRWSRHGAGSRRPQNVFNQRATASNQYGQLHRVDANVYRQLEDLDVEVAHYNINQGAMVAPFYNTRATSLVVVLEGRGRFEMACPHLSSSQSQGRQEQQQQQQQQEESGSAHYQRVSAQLSPQTAFIIPAGHPVSILASDNQNLQIVAFKIGAENNQRNYLAGQDNILNQLEREAKELSFNMPAREVEAILNNQQQSVFLPGPNQRQQQQQQQGGHSGSLLETIVDAVAL